MAGKEQKPKQAVALSYDPDDDAPKVVATGKGALAEKIIEEANRQRFRCIRTVSWQILCQGWRSES